MANVNGVWDDNFIQKFTTYSFKPIVESMANVNGVDNFIQKFTKYSFRSLKVRPTWMWTGSGPETTTLSSFKKSLRTALSRSEVLLPEVRPVRRQLLWGQQPQKWWLLPELALVGRQKKETTTYSFKSKIKKTTHAFILVNHVWKFGPLQL